MHFFFLIFVFIAYFVYRKYIAYDDLVLQAEKDFEIKSDLSFFLSFLKVALRTVRALPHLVVRPPSPSHVQQTQVFLFALFILRPVCLLSVSSYRQLIVFVVIFQTPVPGNCTYFVSFIKTLINLISH